MVDLRKFAEEMDREIHSITDSAMSKLMQYDFPGNVRELENVMERAITLTRSPEIDADVLPSVFENSIQRPSETRSPTDGVDLETLLREYELTLLQESLRQSHGVKTQAAHRLGISFRSFRYRWQKLSKEASPSE